MSPKINKSGVSWEGVPRQRDDEQVPDGEMDESSVNGELDGLEGVQSGPAATEPEDNYEDQVAWSYAALQSECRDRELDGPLNVPREDLIARLRADDEKRDASPVGD